MKHLFGVLLYLLTFVSQGQDYNDLRKQLEKVHTEDQKYRLQADSIVKTFGRQSDQFKNLVNVIDQKDSINKIIVTHILDNYGWIGEKEIGGIANTTLFLVIQHSELITQEKYLPMMRIAVKDGKAKGSDLALLEDRVALGQGKKQIYGSQIRRDKTTGQYYVRALEDPENVDVRRKSVGLEPLAEYVKFWNINWDPKTYQVKD